MRMLNKLIIVLSVVFTTNSLAQESPLPSWNDGKTKEAIIAFVQQVTDTSSPNFVPVNERIATFDNDGTLWSEQPIYFQLAFAFYQIKLMAPKHPEWKTIEPFKSVLADDIKGVLAGGKQNLVNIISASHAGMTSEAFAASVKQWSETAKHPSTGKLYTAMIYQPMLELLQYLRANDFKTFIVSGGGVDFMRVFTEKVYGIPPEQVIGSTAGSHYELRNGIPVIIKDPKIVLVDDKEGKPIGIYRHIGRRPIFAGGNSDGDLAMLEYTTVSRGANDKSLRFGLIVHHTDAEREWAYDRKSHIGTLDKGLDKVESRGWTLIDMKNDWKTIYPSEK